MELTELGQPRVIRLEESYGLAPACDAGLEPYPSWNVVILDHYVLCYVSL